MLIHISKDKKDMLGNDKSQQYIYIKKKAGTMTSNVVHLLDLLIIKRKKNNSFITFVNYLITI